MSTWYDEHTQQRPFWWELAEPRRSGDGELPKKVDVLVIGSGFTGLSAALVLARSGREVAVIDSEAIGYGASSRNGGQIGSGNQRFTVVQMVARYGRPKAAALLREGFNALEFVKRFITDEHIDCELQVVGRFRGALRAHHYDAMARDLDDLRDIVGVESHMVPRAEQHREIDTELYLGGSVLPIDGCLHPALYHRGLLDRARAAGVKAYSHTAAIAVTPVSEGVVVQTSQGAVTARDVVVATNGYTSDATPDYERRVVPIGSAIIATDELPPGLMDRLLPTRRVIGNTARVFHYYRASPDGKRILFGGRLQGPLAPPTPRPFTHLYRDMVALFPALAGIGVSHAWTGYVGYTVDVLPHLGHDGAVHYGLGFCGSGVARASYIGHQLARQILGEPAGATAWDDLDFRPFRFHAAHRLGVPLASNWKRLRDWLE